MDELRKRRIWLPSPGFLVLLGVAVAATAIVIPGLQSSQRASNERHASTALKTLTSAEADFRANDRERMHRNDFWTGDVSGLYYVKPIGGGPEVRLIEEPMAQADAKAQFPLPKGAGPWTSYRFQALDRDDSVKGPEGEYRLDTDKSGRKVHNGSKFGFCAFPENEGSGKFTFVVNENNTIFRNKGATPRTTFPDDQELKKVMSTCRDDD